MIDRTLNIKYNKVGACVHPYISLFCHSFSEMLRAVLRTRMDTRYSFDLLATDVAYSISSCVPTDSRIPNRIGIWKCFLRRWGNRSTRRNNLSEHGENQQQTQPTYDAECGY